MVIHGVHLIRPILIFKLHIVIITALGTNVKFFSHLFSWGTGHIGGIGVFFGGPGHIWSGGGMKDLFFVDGRNCENIFSGVW